MRAFAERAGNAKDCRLVWSWMIGCITRCRLYRTRRGLSEAKPQATCRHVMIPGPVHGDRAPRRRDALESSARATAWRAAVAEPSPARAIARLMLPNMISRGQPCSPRLHRGAPGGAPCPLLEDHPDSREPNRRARTPPRLPRHSPCSSWEDSVARQSRQIRGSRVALSEQRADRGIPASAASSTCDSRRPAPQAVSLGVLKNRSRNDSSVSSLPSVRSTASWLIPHPLCKHQADTRRSRSNWLILER